MCCCMFSQNHSSSILMASNYRCNVFGRNLGHVWFGGDGLWNRNGNDWLPFQLFSWGESHSHSHSDSKGEWECSNPLKSNPHSLLVCKSHSDSDSNSGHEPNALRDIAIHIPIPFHSDTDSNPDYDHESNAPLPSPDIFTAATQVDLISLWIRMQRNFISSRIIDIAMLFTQNIQELSIIYQNQLFKP